MKLKRPGACYVASMRTFGIKGNLPNSDSTFVDILRVFIRAGFKVKIVFMMTGDPWPRATISLGSVLRKCRRGSWLIVTQDPKRPNVGNHCMALHDGMLTDIAHLSMRTPVVTVFKVWRNGGGG